MTCILYLEDIIVYTVNTISEIDNIILDSNKYIFKVLDVDYYYYYDGNILKRVIANTVEEVFKIVKKETIL